MRERKVNQRQIAIARTPTILKTMDLGSCIAIALFDPQRKIGALSHILLPKKDSSTKRTAGNDGKFADSAIKSMIQKMRGAGCDIGDIRAKIVGGAKFFHTNKNRCSGSRNNSIGSANIEMAIQVLNEFGIPIVAQDVGGDYCRRIQFFSHTGKLIVETPKNGTKEL
jgi:chemotaxis protein CheD